jgi:hypothetical protein
MLPELSGRRVKISSPLCIPLSGRESIALVQALLTYRVASEIGYAGSSYQPTLATQVADLTEPTHFILQFADAFHPVANPTPIVDDPSAYYVNIHHLPDNPILSQSCTVPLHIQPHTFRTTVPLTPKIHTIAITPSPVTGHVPRTSWAATCLTTALIQFPTVPLPPLN